MKNIASIFIIMLISLNIAACNKVQGETNATNENKLNTEVIMVYYFHFSHRCATCVAVEEQTLKSLNELYPEKMKSGKITFQSINLDEKEGEELAKKVKVSGQTLIFIGAGKNINLTNDGFMYARNNPEKLKAKIKVTVDKMF